MRATMSVMPTYPHQELSLPTCLLGLTATPSGEHDWGLSPLTPSPPPSLFGTPASLRPWTSPVGWGQWRWLW